MYSKVFARSLTCMVLVCALVITLGASAFSQSQSWTVREDTVIHLRMNDYLYSKTARVGDRFTATVTTPVSINGREVIPAGAIVEGRVTQVTPAKRMGKAGTIAIDFDDLVFPNGARVKLVGSLVSTDPDTLDDEGRSKGGKGKDFGVFVGGGGMVGMVLGGILSGGKGAAVGGAIGAGAGLAAVLLSKGDEAQVPVGTEFGLQLRQPLTIHEGMTSGGRPRVSRNRDYDNSDPGNADPTPDRSVRKDRDPNADRWPRRGEDRRRSADPPARTQPDPEPEDAEAQPEYKEPETKAEPEPARVEPKPEPKEVEPEPVNLPLSSAEMVRRAQIALRDRGYYEGQIDGVMSPRLAGSLRTYQKENKLKETGDLDPDTAKSLGILGGTRASARATDRPATPSPAANPRAGNTPAEVVLATVLSATATRTPDGAIRVSIQTQANTGGWRWFGEHFVNGDVLEVFARAVKPTGIVTQAITRGNIELTVRDRVQYVREVIVHGEGRDQRIALGTGRGASSPGNVNTQPSRPPSDSTRSREVPPRSASETASGAKIQRQAEELLAEYQRILGVRLTGTDVEFEKNTQPREDEIELLFALDSFANAAQLYARVVNSLRDREKLRAATFSLAQQAVRTDRVFTTISSRAAESLAPRWDAIRQDVLKLMREHNIRTSDLGN